MKEEQRLVVAFALAILVVLLFGYYQKKNIPLQQKQPLQTSQQVIPQQSVVPQQETTGTETGTANAFRYSGTGNMF